MKAPIVRVYANWLSERNRWCVDAGPGTEAVAVRAVKTLSPGRTRSIAKRQRDKRVASMWLEFRDAEFVVFHGVATVRDSRRVGPGDELARAGAINVRRRDPWELMA